MTHAQDDNGDGVEAGHSAVRSGPVNKVTKFSLVNFNNSLFSRKTFLLCIALSVPLMFLMGYHLHRSPDLYSLFTASTIKIPIYEVFQQDHLAAPSNSLNADQYDGQVIPTYHHPTRQPLPAESGSNQEILHGYEGQNVDSRSHNQNTSRVCSPVVNIAFIKVHKAGSTTVASIFLRFAYKYRLSAAVPSGGQDVWLGWPRPISQQYIMPPYRGSVRHEPYNILAHHSIYDERRFKAIMPPDTLYFAILREPYQHFLSSFRYMNVGASLKIKAENPLVEFLKNPTKYENMSYVYGGYPISLTRNLMSYDMGLPPSLYNNTQLIANYIRYLDSKFRLIMLLEHLEESIILLKRYLCWKLEDLIFIKVLPEDEHKIKTAHLTQDNGYLRNLHSKWSAADYMLYHYFNATLWAKIQREPQEEFYDEVQNFKRILNSISHFCADRGPMPGQTLKIPKSKWNNEFIVTSTSCGDLRINDLQYTHLFRRRYKAAEGILVRRS